jgi:two-component system LytT family sensor kinase
MNSSVFSAGNILFPATKSMRIFWHCVFWLVFISIHLVFFLPVVLRSDVTGFMVLSYVMYYAKFAPIFYGCCIIYKLLSRFFSGFPLWILLFLSAVIFTHIFSVLTFIVARELIGLENSTPSFEMLGTHYLNPGRDYRMWLTLVVFDFQDMQLLLLPTGFKVFKYGISYQKARQDLETERIKTELSNLKSQLDPHFVINIINSAYLQILPIQQDAAEYLAKLASIIRFALEDGSQDMISLKKEISCFKDLVHLEATRRRFRLEHSIQESGQIQPHHKIPSLVLLTLAENAFKHGLKSTVATNKLNIQININEDKLEFYMENSKSENLGYNDDRQRSGIGLENIVRRLTLHFKDDFSFETQDASDTYRVNLIIPLADQTN